MKEDNKINNERYNIINGKIKKSKGDIGDLKDFIKRWEIKIDGIKLIPLDNQQSYNLANDYLREWDKFMYRNELDSEVDLLNQLANDLFLAITIANNNYRKQFPTFWQNFHKLKLPDLHLHKNG